jgi:hypothetical protein
MGVGFRLFHLGGVMGAGLYLLKTSYLVTLDWRKEVGENAVNEFIIELLVKFLDNKYLCQEYSEIGI